jgi:Zn finger protein HypA/HybF involved in hydrogenase expression
MLDLHARARSGAHLAGLLVRSRGSPSEEVRVHELSLMDDLVSVVESEVGDQSVATVRLVLGRHACASAHALRFCFDLCSRGTVLEGARLEIIETNGEELRLEDVEVM